jgi:c-di-GMP-binding flagellar brake protein YcgR
MAFRQEERRRFPRVNFRAPIRFEVVGEPDFDNAVSIDLSDGGLSFANNKFLAPSTDLILEISVLSRVLKAIGKVVWSYHLPHSDNHRFGIEFIKFDPFEKQYLSNYLKLLAQQK